MKIAVYPGSFDPITNGHIDVLKRSLKAFDEVILLLAINPRKKSHFSVEERLAMMKESVKDIPGVLVDSTTGLSVTYAKEHGANCLVRGLRAVTDFEYEFQMAAANKYIDPEVETVFFCAESRYTFISSSYVNELSAGGVNVSGLVPQAVLPYLAKKK